MQRTRFFVILLLLTTHAATAKINVIDKVTELLSYQQNFTGNFVQRYYFDNELVDEVSGRFALQKPNAVLWQVQQPYAQVILSRNDNHLFYDIDLDQLDKIDDAQWQQNFAIQLLQGQLNIVQSYAVVASQSQSFTLFNDSDGQTVTLTFNKDILKDITWQQNSDAVIYFSFSNLTKDGAKLPKKLFKLSNYQLK